MNTYVNDGVGKRIVDALKRQSEMDFNQGFQPVEKVVSSDNVQAEAVSGFGQQAFQTSDAQFVSQPAPASPSISMEQNIQSQNLGYTSGINSSSMFSQNIYGDANLQEMPANVLVLKQLVSQLPSGVSRQAGALVIKQTMEALGISMKTVLQEAQQMQESLNISARECQNSILECKKQINTLEAQVQQYQRQSASLNDIVSLFLQLH